jgi:GxxExxY protein
MLADAPFNGLTGTIIGAAIEVHSHLGPGLLESVYLRCLQFELTAQHLRWVSQRPVPITYKRLTIESTYRVDLIVEDTVVVEAKALERLLPLHQAQLLTYLAITDCPAGLLLNFNVSKMTDGIKRLVRPARSRALNQQGGF